MKMLRDIIKVGRKEKVAVCERPPGMISEAEWQWFHDWAAREYTGQGEIADLGCWLGLTTTALASGLAYNKQVKRKQARIFAYDRFIWENGSERFLKSHKTLALFRPGESCLGQFLEFTMPYRDMTEVCAGDLCKTGWNGSPIEFLLVDAMKSWRTTNAVIRNFFPFLIPGKSLVAQQDFGHYFTSWIHLMHYRLRPYFEPVINIPSSGTMIFRLTGTLPEEIFLKEFDFSDFSDDEADRAFGASLRMSHTTNMDAVRSSHIMYYVHKGNRAKAREWLAAYEKEGTDVHHPEIEDAVTMMKKLA